MSSSRRRATSNCMDKAIFAIGPNDAFFYYSPRSSPKCQWSTSGHVLSVKISLTSNRNNIPAQIASTLSSDTIYKVICAAFGDDKNSFVLAYRNTLPAGSHELKVLYGERTPVNLTAWLNRVQNSNPSSLASLKVSLGPKRSFIAWTENDIRWDRLPAKLDEHLQSWMSRGRWKKSPRIVALGHDGAFFAIPEGNERPAQWLPESMSTCRAWMENLRSRNINDWAKVPVRRRALLLISADAS